MVATQIELELHCDRVGIEFGLQELRESLAERSHTLRAHAPDSDDRLVRVQLDSGLPSQGFRITSTGQTIDITGGDSAGAMYGLLELAEQIRLYDLNGVIDTAQVPAQERRGIKFNIPLDVRTPTYTESSDTAQHAMIEVWDATFWHELVDRLARHRYNLVSLWNLHPFPSLVRVPEYPDVALDDVRRSTAKWDEHYPLQATGYDSPDIVDHYETLKVMTIDEKITFWRGVMAYAKDRHVQFYIVTWNIFVNGTDGKYGITDDIHNPNTRDYFRASVRALFDTYPDLAGIGLTTGENMPAASFEEKEQWAFSTYGLGVLEASRAHPARNITFIHRQHQTRARDIADEFRALIDAPNIEFLFSFKYAEAHVMSSTRQPYADRFIEDIPPQRTLWTLRNDDNYLFRWGGADFVREFVRGLPAKVSAGMYYGSDQWVWAREFMSTEPSEPRMLELEKHWFHWLLWGRLAYDPSLGNERLVDLIGARFPRVDPALLFQAWNNAAMIYPLTTGFHWGALDFQWYIEACQSLPGAARTPTGFHDLNRFVSLPPHPGTDNLSIPDHVAAQTAGISAAGTSPLQVAEKLIGHAEAALSAADRIDASGDRELRRTLEDIRAQAYLGSHYAHKIRAATALAFLRETLDVRHREVLESELGLAAHHWRRYTATAEALYRLRPLWTNRVGNVDLAQTYQSVLYDITIAGVASAIPSIDPTPGGPLLEAEDAVSIGPVRKDVPGFTGTGYIDLSSSEGTVEITWTYEATRDGTHLLEFRHIQRWGGARIPARLSVNEEEVEDFALVHSGSSENWVWDRATVRLRAGPNTIVLRPGAAPLLDHLNIVDTGY
jgi:hypothetical protein